jgi:hypothetical protein
MAVVHVEPLPEEAFVIIDGAEPADGPRGGDAEPTKECRELIGEAADGVFLPFRPSSTLCDGYRSRSPPPFINI